MFCFLLKEDDGKVASWLHSHVKLLYKKLSLLLRNIIGGVPVLFT